MPLKAPPILFNQPTFKTMKKILLLFILSFVAIQVSAQEENYFITQWKTDNAGTSNPTSIIIPTTGVGYDYEVNWNFVSGEAGTWETFAGDATHDYGTAGTYEVAIRGDFPRIYFDNTLDNQKIVSIEQWGSNPWTSMHRAFMGCSNLKILAADVLT